MTKEEKLLEAQKSTQIWREKMDDKLRRRKRIQIGFLCAVAVSILIGMAGTPISDKIAFTAYQKNPGPEISTSVFRNKEGYQLWQENALHNDINCLLTGGNFYDNGDGLIISPSSDCSQMEITENGRSRIFSDSLCSYLNVAGDTVYYRKDSDHCIYQSSVADGEEHIFYSGNAGEVYLYGDYIYFIDLSGSRSVVRMHTNGSKEPEMLVKQNVKEFFVYGDQCVYLTDGNGLYYQDINKKAVGSAISGSYSRFFFNGDIVVQSGKRIIAFETEGGNSRLLYEDKENDYRLVGAGNGCFYIQEGSSVKKIPVDSKSGDAVEYVESGGRLALSLLETENGLNAIVYEMDGEGVTTTKAEFHTQSEKRQGGEQNGRES